MFHIVSRAFGFSVFCVVASALTACTTVDFEAAAKLSNVGQSASATMHKEAEAARADFLINADRSDLLVFLGRVSSALEYKDISAEIPQSNEKRAQRRNIALMLHKRERALELLSQAYLEFGALVNQEPGADVLTATDELATGINDFIGVIQSIPQIASVTLVPISGLATAAVAEGIALLAEEQHRKLIVSTNEDLMRATAKLAEAIELEAEYSRSIRRETIQSLAQLKSLLLEFGIAEYGETAAQLTSLANVAPVKDPSKVFRGSGIREKRLRAAVSGYLNSKATREAEAVSESYSAMINSLVQLEKAHRALTSGQAYNLELLQSWIGRLEEASGRIVAAAKSGN